MAKFDWTISGTLEQRFRSKVSYAAEAMECTLRGIISRNTNLPVIGVQTSMYAETRPRREECGVATRMRCV